MGARVVWAELCGLILTGGEGKRLRPLTERIAGDGRPKQVCPVVGPETLLEQTRRRVALVVPQGRTVVVLNDFSRQVLAKRRANLAGLPVNGVDWSDPGEPRCVLATLSRVGIRPEWAEPVLATTA